MRVIHLRPFSPYYYKNYGVKVALSWYNELWWRFMPGTCIRVRWPVGPVVVGKSMRPGVWRWPDDSCYTIDSADPNDHFRPWLEVNVGKQGWDWDWTMLDSDISENKLTIKFRRGKESWSTLASLMWI